MAASPAQIAANRSNALQSTGPKTGAGKDASRRNALKHGLTGRGVVIPGEDEHEVALRVAALEDQLVPEGDILTALLVRQVAIASIRVERAYRHETALAAERMRRAADVYDDDRKAMAEQILGEIKLDPVTARRRLLAAPEGVDALLGRLRALREQAEPRSFVAWDDAEGVELDLCLGCRPGQAPLSRVGLLTRGIVYDFWEGLDPAEHAHLDFAARLHWAVGAIHTLITAEITHLEAHRASLDPERPEKGRAEAAERSLLDLGCGGDGVAAVCGGFGAVDAQAPHGTAGAAARGAVAGGEPSRGKGGFDIEGDKSGCGTKTWSRFGFVLLVAASAPQAATGHAQDIGYR